MCEIVGPGACTTRSAPLPPVPALLPYHVKIIEVEIRFAMGLPATDGDQIKIKISRTVEDGIAESLDRSKQWREVVRHQRTRSCRPYEIKATMPMAAATFMSSRLSRVSILSSRAD